MRCLRLSVSKRSCQGRVVQRHLSSFRVIDHVVPCQHTRHYPGGVEPDFDDHLKLAVKQYVPIHNENSNSVDQGVTIIGAHANGFPKELYEPLWDDIHERLEAQGKQIRAIWVADIATQNQSGILNETILGNDPSWFDHARDLLYLINQKQGEMPQPLIGIGHSMGASQLTALSLIHPRLLQALVLIEPVIQTENPSMTFAPPSTYRRDVWPSREDVAISLRKSKVYQQWDPRVLEQWIKYGLRELPTELYPDVQEDKDGKVPVTLATTKAQEVLMYLRPLYKGDPWSDMDLYADFDPEVLDDHDRFYRPEPRAIFRRLPELFPPTHYIFGSQSELSTPELRRKKLEATGTGIGGKGGVSTGQVSHKVLDCGHLAVMQKPTDCAADIADFISKELEEWTVRKQSFETAWFAKTRRERAGIDDDWKKNIGPPPERPPKAATATPTAAAVAAEQSTPSTSKP